MSKDIRTTLALVLGGGASKGLWPLTEERCKPAIPFGGRYRLIDVTISNCINSKVPRVLVLTQYNSESLNRHINLTYRFDYFTQGFVEILAAEQRQDCEEWFRGSANALRHVWNRVKRYGCHHILVLPGEQLYKMDYRRLLDKHIETGANVTMLTAPILRSDAHLCGLVRLAKDNEIVDFTEKPGTEEEIDSFCLEDNAEACMANMGGYIFDVNTLEKLLVNNKHKELGAQIIPAAVDSALKVYAYPFEGYWENVNSISSYFNASLTFAERFSPINIYDQDTPVYTNPRFLPSAKLYSCSLSSSLVADGCVLEHADLHNCVIGPRSFVRAGATLKEVVMMGADHFERLNELRENRVNEIPNIGVGHHSLIEKAIIDKNARIGNHVHIINKDHVTEGEGDGFAIRDGIVIIRKNAIILDGSVI